MYKGGLVGQNAERVSGVAEKLFGWRLNDMLMGRLAPPWPRRLTR